MTDKILQTIFHGAIMFYCLVLILSYLYYVFGVANSGDLRKGIVLKEFSTKDLLLLILVIILISVLAPILGILSLWLGLLLDEKKGILAKFFLLIQAIIILPVTFPGRFVRWFISGYCRFISVINDYLLNHYVNGLFKKIAKDCSLKDWELLRMFVYQKSGLEEKDSLELFSGYAITDSTIGLCRKWSLNVNFSYALKRDDDDFWFSLVAAYEFYLRLFRSVNEANKLFFLIGLVARYVFNYCTLVAMEKSWKQGCILEEKETIKELQQVFISRDRCFLSMGEYLQAPYITKVLREFYRVHRIEYEKNSNK